MCLNIFSTNQSIRYYPRAVDEFLIKVHTLGYSSFNTKIQNMSIQDIANRLVELCKAGDYKTCYQELFSPEIVSIEADGSSVKGFDQMAEKGKQWNAGIAQMHDTWMGDPIVSGNWFSLPMGMNMTRTGETVPTKFEEICVYQVQNGKIVKEQFFYDDAGSAS